MANALPFWEVWAPHLAYLEDNHLDLRTINALAQRISGPILVVGGGQGLLVNELRKKGFQADGVDSCPAMVELAARRRGVDLIQTDGTHLPFADESYNTSIVATGVIDFMDDEGQICRIIEETSRVTKKPGTLLVAFYRINPVMERFLRRVRIVTADGILRRRRFFELSRLDLKGFFSAVKKEGNLGFWDALVEVTKLQLGLSRQERILSKNLAMILKSADNPDELIGSVSESIPYRTQASIQALFKGLNIPVQELMAFDSCIIADVGIKA